jgi:uncharacterized membrane protein YqaE (UPF0057 family)
LVIMRIIFIILLLSLGVFLQVNLGKYFRLNIITLCGHCLRIIHAINIIAKKW